MRPAARAWLPLGLFVATAALYGAALDRAPVYFSSDEAHFITRAHALAATGRDSSGGVPLFFAIDDPLEPRGGARVWYQPALFYLLAADFRIAPVAEWSARLPTVLIGALDVALMFLVSRRLLRSTTFAILTAAALALTPAHFLMSRQAVDYICPLPLVLAWLLFALRYDECRRRRDLALAAVFLGTGLFTYISSWFVMPLLAILTAVATRPGRRDATAGVLAFIAPLALSLPLVLSQPHVLADIAARYGLSATHARFSFAALLDFNFGQRVSLYWNYFNPSFLFFAGGSDALMATGRAGVFLLPMAVFIAIGIHALLRARSTPAILILGGLVAAPLPVVLAMPEAPDHAIARTMTMVVFGVLIAGIGGRASVDSTVAGMRAGAIVLALIVPIQFAAFLRDYFGDYQTRSARRFDPLATREVMREVAGLTEADSAPVIFLVNDFENKAIRWQLAALRFGRDDLWSRTRYLDWPPDPATIAAGSVVVLNAGDPRAATLQAAGFSRRIDVEGAGGAGAVILLRVQAP